MHILKLLSTFPSPMTISLACYQLIENSLLTNFNKGYNIFVSFGLLIFYLWLLLHCFYIAIDMILSMTVTISFISTINTIYFLFGSLYYLFSKNMLAKTKMAVAKGQLVSCNYYTPYTKPILGTDIRHNWPES